MTERINRRDLIIEVASRLFVEQGYTATSVRQIAEAVGCTEAALYYHFKDGKRELLQAVFERNIPDFLQSVEACDQAPSLRDLVACLIRRLLQRAEDHTVNQLRWIFAEFPKLTDEERLLFYNKNDLLRTALKAQFRRYVQDDAEAERLTWLIIFTGFGYGQLMIILGLRSVVDFDMDGFIDFLADRITAGHE